MNYAQEYRRIMQEEFRLKTAHEIRTSLMGSAFVIPAHEIAATAEQLSEIAKNALVTRSYVYRYGLNESKTTHESVSAHANLMMALVDRALACSYGSDFGEPDGAYPRTSDGYSYREIMEAIRLHDLPENDIGDWPDNGSRDELAKQKMEETYFTRFADKYPLREVDFKRRVLELLRKMDDAKSTTGRLLKVADKTAATFIVLTYDGTGQSPLMHVDDPNASGRDHEEMALCDWEKDGYHRASEMWTIDHFRIRKFTELDDTGFFTALIVMYTLMVHGRWYNWREQDYKLS